MVIRDFNLFRGFYGIVNFLVIHCLIAYIIQESAGKKDLGL